MVHFISVGRRAVLEREEQNGWFPSYHKTPNLLDSLCVARRLSRSTPVLLVRENEWLRCPFSPSHNRNCYRWLTDSESVPGVSRADSLAFSTGCRASRILPKLFFTSMAIMPPKIEAYNFKAACQTRDMERHRHVGDGWKNEERIGIESRGDIGTSHGHDGRGGTSNSRKILKG
jgi:hypothetical protein